MTHPMQPIIKDESGTIRFKENAIVRLLLESPRPLNLNDLALIDFSPEDQIQFAQLIGYSLSGFHELSYVTDEAAAAATKAAREIEPNAKGCRDLDGGCPYHSGIK